MSDIYEKDIWCADATDPSSLPDRFGTIEIGGETGNGVNIQPGYDNNAVYDEERDGEIFVVPEPEETDDDGVACAVFWNWAMKPGWQKWRHPYRYGIIDDIDHSANTCKLELNTLYATDEPDEQQLDINQQKSVDATFEYMSCNSTAFEDGDEVIVKFEFDSENNWINPKVIGFKSEPRGCCSRLVFKAGDYYAVWDIASGEVILSPTNIEEDYSEYVPDPFVGNDRCLYSEYYWRQSVPVVLGAPDVVIDEEYTHIYLECDESTMDEDLLLIRTIRTKREGDNYFGHCVSEVVSTISYVYAPFCDDGGYPDSGGVSTGSTSGTATYHSGDKFICLNGDAAIVTSHVTTSISGSGTSYTYDHSIVDPCGGGSSSDVILSYEIRGYGFYSVDIYGEPITGPIVTWFVNKLSGTYAVSATSDANIDGTTAPGSLTISPELATMLLSLINQGGESVSYIFA